MENCKHCEDDCDNTCTEDKDKGGIKLTIVLMVIGILFWIGILMVFKK